MCLIKDLILKSLKEDSLPKLMDQFKLKPSQLLLWIKDTSTWEDYLNSPKRANLSSSINNNYKNWLVVQVMNSVIKLKITVGWITKKLTIWTIRLEYRISSKSKGTTTYSTKPSKSNVLISLKSLVIT